MKNETNNNNNNKESEMQVSEATKITVKNEKGTAILLRANDGKWDITINGRSGGSAYYDNEQVQRMIDNGGMHGEVTFE